jgi:hypothetical protein
MNTFKRKLAKLLAFAMIIGCIDLSWLDLSEPLTVIAATATDITDSYKAYADIQKVTDTTTSNLKSLLHYDTEVSTKDTTSSPSSISATTFTWNSKDVTDGIYTFNQRKIEATAQVKSGNWLNDTVYEATTGTPTTESLFVTAGGTQWIVDLQYRYISAPYVRTYTFDAVSTPNYRYYSLGDVDTSVDLFTNGTLSKVTYTAQAKVPYDISPSVYTGYSKIVGSGKVYNYAYKYFEKNTQESLDNPEEDPDYKTVDVSGINGAKGGTITFYTADGWDENNWTNKVAPVSKIISSNDYSTGSTDYVTPDVAQAILVKQHAFDAILEIMDMWEEQCDNYRADQGVYDTDPDASDTDELDSDNDDSRPDELSFMYTYSGLARHTTIYESAPGVYTPATHGDTTVSSDFWNPVFVSYLYDWNSYYEHNDMDKTYGSTHAQLGYVKDVGAWDKSVFYNNVTEQVNESVARGTEVNATQITGIFALDPRDSAISLNYSGAYDTWDDTTLGNFKFASIIAQSAGSNVCIALSDYSKVYAISDGLTNNGYSKMEISDDASLVGNLTNINYNFHDYGFVEEAYLYYRSIYSIMLNYGSLFYYDEAKALFAGAPGFPILSSASDINAYNAAVNKNLAALFGHGNENQILCRVSIPFAIFPIGGDLDGEMEDSTSGQSSNMSVTVTDFIVPASVEPSYMYLVTMYVTIGGYKNNMTEDSPGTKTYATTRHADGTTKNSAGTSSYDECVASYNESGALPTDYTDCISYAAKKCSVCNGTGSHSTGLTTDWTGVPGAWTDSCGSTSTAQIPPTTSHTCVNCTGTGEEPNSNHDPTTHTHYIQGKNAVETSGVSDNNHEDRIYKETCEITSTHGVVKSTNMWTESPRTMSASTSFKQLFENVQWLDITGYKLWQINNMTVKGLGNILYFPVSASNYNAKSTSASAIVSQAVTQMGYECYNINDNDILNIIDTNTHYSGNSTTFTTCSTVSGLQTHGRVANSFYTGSSGNLTTKYKQKLRINTSAIRPKINSTIYYYRTSDVPYLSLGSYVNSSYSAFKLSSIDDNDNVHFKYYATRQGGRSHTTFYGFVNQALALTLYYASPKYESVTSYSSSYNKIGYGNSLLIQGDYLTIDTVDDNYITLAGDYYNTWLENAGAVQTSSNATSGKYALMPDGFNRLSIYASTCRWIPARLSVILARSPKQSVYGTDVISNDTDCFIIHTYCRGINTNTHTVWDSLGGTGAPGATTGSSSCNGSNCYMYYNVGLETDKGSVNPNRNTKTVVLTLSSNYTESPYHYHTTTSLTYDNTQVIDLAELLYENKGYYEQFKNDEGEKCTVSSDGVIHIKMNKKRLSEGMNTANTATVANTNIADNMPYIGYQSQGIDDKDISKTGTETNKQKGYTEGFTTNFDRTKAFGNYTANSGNINFTTFNPLYATPSSNILRCGVKETTDTAYPTTYDNWIKRYPYLINLNIKRYQANNLYTTGYTDVNYSKVGELAKEISYGPALRTGTGTGSNEKIVLNAHFLKTGSYDKSPTNEIVIYNPVATESARIVPLSTYLPDGGNTGTNSSNQRDYNTAYLASFLNYTRRDTRLEYKYVMDTTSTGNTEQYLTGTGIMNQSSKSTSQIIYTMKEASSTNTTAYTMSDYTVSVSSNNTWSHDNNSDWNDVYVVEKSGLYDMCKVFTDDNFASVSIYLNTGDIIKFSKSAHAVLYKPTNDYLLTWSAFTEAYKTLQKTTTDTRISSWTEDQISTGLPLYKGMSMIIGADNWQLKSGTMYKLSLTVSNTYEAGYKGIADALSIGNINDITVYSETSITDKKANTTTYNWYLEANSDVVLTGIPITVNKDCFLWSGITFETQEVVLFNLSENGTTWSGDVSSYDFFYNKSVSYSDLQSKSQTFYNTKLVDVRGSKVVAGSVLTAQGFYLGLRDQTVSISLKSSALNNPHKVPNTYWKYYVLGWETTEGQIIKSINDDVLNDPECRLKVPSDTTYFDTGYVTVAMLDDAAKKGHLGIYRTESGSYGLIDLNSDGTFTRESKYTGYSVPNGYFDTISFGTSTTLTTGTVMPKASTMNSKSIASKSYEVVFTATQSSGLAYDVKYSQNTEHKCSKGTSDDWNSETVSVITFNETTYNQVFEDSISLDDEFTIYWDNYTQLNLNESNTRSYTETSKVLGVGWDNLSKDSQTDVPCYSDWNTVKTNTYWQTVDYSSTTNAGSVTDTTKWIYNKYVIFNVDMYAFTTGSSYVYDESLGDQQGSYVWDPTTPAYDANGNPNNIVYIPAGQKVYLGYYVVNGSQGDDKGHFVDYGYNYGSTNDPNTDYYTYHFWCPLSNGEADDIGTVQFVVNAINSVSTDKAGGTSNGNKRLMQTYTGSGTSRVYSKTTVIALQRYDGTSKITDEWGNAVVNAVGLNATNNVKTISGAAANYGSLTINYKDSYGRYENAINSTSFSIVGRVGALTIVDSGDPRYQDSFKVSDASSPYAISPIVRLITKYSNIKNENGSQYRYLTDITDVRGRNLEVENSSTGYVVAKNGDTYGDNIWYQENITTASNYALRFILPAGSDFNIHSELTDTLTTSKIGYELYCSLETIGNYYGSSGTRTTTDSTAYVNNNLDYGQTKLQIHPMYIAVDSKGNFQAVDVYMRKGTSYYLINAGSAYASSSAESSSTANVNSTKNGKGSPYYLEDAFDATYTSSIDTNTAGVIGNTFSLDQNMLRRLVTDSEAQTTYNVLQAASNYAGNSAVSKGITTSLLNSNTYGTDGIGGEGLDYSYIYGNAQMFFLREYNRTFIGGTTLALNEKVLNNDFVKNITTNAERYAQKWYFGIGLPASAVFVPHGEVCNEKNILSGNFYVLCVIDVYAIGEKWAVHYESELSKESITINGKTYSSSVWNVYSSTFPDVIPVCMYDASRTTAAGDQDTQGSH